MNNLFKPLTLVSSFFLFVILGCGKFIVICLVTLTTPGGQKIKPRSTVMNNLFNPLTWVSSFFLFVVLGGGKFKPLN